MQQWGRLRRGQHSERIYCWYLGSLEHLLKPLVTGTACVSKYSPLVTARIKMTKGTLGTERLSEWPRFT